MLVLVVVAWSGLSPASGAEPGADEDYRNVTDGLTALHMAGTAGGVALQGRRAFPLAISSQRQIVLAAGYYDDRPRGGRIVAMAHTSFADATSDEQTLFLKNVARWAGRADVPRVVCVGATPKGWLAADLKAVPVTTDLPKSLSEADVAVVNLHSGAMTGALSALKEFAAQGGGVILVATPWAAAAPQLEAANDFLAPAGLTFTAHGSKESAYPVLPDAPSPFLSFLNAIDGAMAHKKGLKKLDLADQQTCAATLDAVLSAKTLPAGFQAEVAELSKTFGRVPKAVATTGKNTQPLEAAIARYQARVP